MPSAARWSRPGSFRWALRVLALGSAVLLLLVLSPPASARPNTHAPAISTWDSRASSVVLGLGRAVSGTADFSTTSYNANFSSTSGVLSAQFGAHYVTYADGEASAVARGFSAGGVALFSFPLSERRASGIPGSAFAFYLGGVPTALFSGQRNFISIPLVLGVGVPFSPADVLTLSPWVELSPALNFDTRIQEISTDEAIQAAMDGTLTRAEVEDLVERGLDINRATNVGKRAGLALELHLGRDVDIDAHVTLGIGHQSAIGLGAAFVFRWDDMVPGIRPAGADSAELDCGELEARFRACPAAQRWRARTRPRPAAPAAARVPLHRAPPARSTTPRSGPRPVRPAKPAERRAEPAPSSAAAASPARSTTKNKASQSPTPSTVPAPSPQKRPPSAPDVPPLQAAPPRRQ